MALSPQQQNYITKNANASKAVLEMYTRLRELDYLWAGVPNYNAAITDQEIAEVDSFAAASLTHEHIAGAQTALSNIKNAIENAFGDLAFMSQL